MFLLPWAHLCLQGHACSDKTVAHHKLGHPDLNSLSHRPCFLNLQHVPNQCSIPPPWPHSPGVRELKVGEVEDPLAVGAVVIVHKLLQLHLAVLLLGDVCHIHTSLRAWGGSRGG